MFNMIRRDPFFELTNLQDRFNQLFNQTLGTFEPLALEPRTFTTSLFVPVDILENEENLILLAELPGVNLEDLTITLENNVLTITGERKFEEEEKKENFFRMERRFGKFTRSFTLPVSVDPEKVVATFENGVLHITLAKREEFKPKQIAIGVTPAVGKAVKGKAA
jgi:HSP20 family protein